MSWRRRSAAIVWGAVVVPTVLRADTPGYPEQVIQWTVKAGESCEDISRAVYGSTKFQRLVQRYNQVTCVRGAPLTQGLTLVLPASTRAVAPAKLASVKQDTVTKPPGGSWAEAQAGQPLQTNASVNTRESGRAGIVFSDQSRIFLSENTLVVIFASASQSSVGSTGALPTVELSEGELQAGIAALRGGEARVAVEGGGSVAAASTDVVIKRQSGKTNVSVFDGKASVSSSNRVVTVPKHFGTRFETGKAPEPPSPLPAAPGWDGGHDPIVFGEDAGTLNASWTPIENAKFYRVQVARDSEFTELVVSEQVDPGILSFRGEGFAPGVYHLRVRAIDVDDFLGIASETRTITVAGLSLSKGATLRGERVLLNRDGEVNLRATASLEVSVDGVAWQPFKGRIDPTTLINDRLMVRTRGEPSSLRTLSFESVEVEPGPELREVAPPTGAIVAERPRTDALPWRGPTLGFAGLASTDGFVVVQPRPRSMAFLSIGASGVDEDARLRALVGARGALGPVGLEAQISSADWLLGSAADETAWLGSSAHLEGADDRLFNVGAGLRVGIPLSTTAPAPRLEPTVALGGELEAFSWVVNLGARFRLESDEARFPTDEGQGFVLLLAAYDPLEFFSVFGMADARLATPETTEPLQLRGGLGGGFEVGSWIFGSASARVSPWAGDVGYLSGMVALGVREPDRRGP